jgi:hypothetical protein
MRLAFPSPLNGERVRVRGENVEARLFPECELNGTEVCRSVQYESLLIGLRTQKSTRTKFKD